MKRTDPLSEKILLLLGFTKEQGHGKVFEASIPAYTRNGVTVYYNGEFIVSDDSPSKNGVEKYISTDKALITVGDLRSYYESKTGRSLGLYYPN